MSYKPFIYKIPTSDVSDIYKNNSVISSSNIEQPLFSLGFHSFIHRTKSAMAITNKLETKNKFYYVVNPFEHNINDYDKDIAHVSESFLNKNDNVPILSRAFYKMWEMLYLFDIASKDKMVMVGLAEGPGSFIQSFVEFREQFFDAANDTVYGLTINSDNTMNINKTMIDSINSRYENMINVIKTSKNGKDMKGGAKSIKGTRTLKTELASNGDLTQVNTIKYLKDSIKQKADLITADGGFEWKNENYQEQEAYTLILGEIISAISIQAKGGSFVLKVFETFTNITIKLITLLTSFYEDVYIYKPFFSRATNSEKYIICKKFKDTDNSKHIALLEETLKKCHKAMYTDNLFINDIFPDFNVSQEQLNIFKYININIANTQQIMINNLVVYIKSNNYFGDSYHSYREQQIKANKWWIDYFLTDKLISQESLVKETIKYNDSEINLFVKKLL
jgi:23S rRNA U2552 (ribose-2'-O)-methylase RlmE/FtsJ